MSQRNAEQLPEAGREQSVLLSRVNHRTGVCTYGLHTLGSNKEAVQDGRGACCG